MEGVKVEVLSKETTKPSSPTPPHLLTHNLSFLDQINTSLYIPIFLFYSNNTKTSSISTDETNRCGWLKNSLSKILTHYYPFAGRFTDSTARAITCNDEGVDFYEAQVNCPLSQVLRQCNSYSINVLFPEEFFMKESVEGSLLAVQVNFFYCGGMAVALCISHKIVDGCSLGEFLSDWAYLARFPSEKIQVSPTFIEMQNGPFPLPPTTTDHTNEINAGKKCITKRFVIDASKIAILKKNSVESSGLKLGEISGEEVVTALLYKCAVAAAASGANKDVKKKSVLVMMVDMRPNVDPPLPLKYTGNFTWFSSSTLNIQDKAASNANEFIGQIRGGIAEVCNKEKNNLKMNEWVSALPTSLYIKLATIAHELMTDAEKIMGEVAYKFSNHCSSPYYEVDFGMGKPEWVSLAMANGSANRLFALMPTKDGVGIEALVTLTEEEMKLFELDEELLAFACSDLTI